MTRSRMDRRRRTKFVFGVLSVGIVMRVLVAFGLTYPGQTHPRFELLRSRAATIPVVQSGGPSLTGR
jgi:hypothetical protein